MKHTITLLIAIVAIAFASHAQENALDFDGTNDYVNVPYNASLAPSQLTLECWVKPQAVNVHSGIVTTEPTEFSGQIGYGFRQRMDNIFWFDIGGDGYGSNASSTTNITTGIWYHLAGTFDGTKLKLYVNGILEGTTTTLLAISSTADLRIGCLFSNKELFSGQIDEVRVWNIVRTGSEIQTDMLTTPCEGEIGLVAYCNFNQGIASGTNTSETTLYDLTSNNNNGTLNNFALTGSTSNWVTGVLGLTENCCTTPTATITPLGNLDICTTGIVNLKASTGNNYTYQWNRNNIIINGATNKIFHATQTGNYRVKISSGKGCNAVSKKTTVYTSCKLAEEEELNSSLNLYPNPTAGTFTLDLKLNDEENSQAIIQVLNMLGQVMYEETTSVANGMLQKEIQLSEATADGMYLVKVTINDQVFSSQINYQK